MAAEQSLGKHTKHPLLLEGLRGSFRFIAITDKAVKVFHGHVFISLG